MELLIPGLILVALMVWASTKIKRQAAEAFEPEEIEIDGFAVSKPEGFLHVINSRTNDLFEAYTKDFGEGEEDGIRRATAHITDRGSGLQQAVDNVKGLVENISDDQQYELGEAHVVQFSGERLEKGIT